MRVPIKTRGVCALIVLLDQGGIISVLTVLANLFSSRRSSIPLLEYGVWSLNSGISSPAALAIWTIASQKPTLSLSLVSDQLFLTLFQMLSNISISPSFIALKIVSSVFVPIVRGISFPNWVSSSVTKATQSKS